jgi:hypothetical protein
MTLILGFLAFAPGNAAEPKRTQADWDNLKGLHAGQKIEVVDMKMKTLKGQFVSFTDEAIWLRDGNGEQSVPRANVVRVSVRDTSRRTRNMLLASGVIGGIALIPATIGLAINSNEGNSCTACVAAIAAGFGGGAALGAISGSRTVYRAKK